MKMLKSFSSIIVGSLFLTGCTALNQTSSAINDANSGVVAAMLLPYQKLDSQWRGKPLIDFQNRFGAPRGKDKDGNSVWARAIIAHIPGQHVERMHYLPNMTITRHEFVPAHDAQRNCEIAVKVQTKRIVSITTRRDIGIPTDNYRLFSGMESTCQRIFGL
ncbi:hypothetical protein [Rhizobium rhizogenes]|uniref:hypothetical protein n=1 Tax=Rhizobium rhizogenes TaxID=359 RepID=UPI0022BC9266|nr:hypothetical protein [Rhizobium rhizogenes]MCZ7479599.1 hypothetical protein [Rhizobium rhizogenes]